MNEKLKNIFCNECSRLGITLRDEQIKAFFLYLEEIKKWSEKINITSIRNEREIVIKHFIDSLLPLKFIPKNSFILDIGSGAGFPGIPLKIADQSLRVMLIEAVKKKVFFLKHMIRLLQLKGIDAIHQRAEDKTFSSIMRGKVDVVISRAFGSIDEILKIACSYITVGGKLVIMSGKTRENNNNYEDIFRKGRLRTKSREDFTLPEDTGERNITVLEKIA